LLVLLSFLLSGNCLAELGFRLRECGFIGSWINPQEQFAFFTACTFFEGYLLDITVHELSAVVYDLSAIVYCI
jgi:hypothetical protein